MIWRSCTFSLVCISAFLLGATTPFAKECREITSVRISASVADNTEAGGHVTQHILGEDPPQGKPQSGKTLFRAAADFVRAWEAYVKLDKKKYGIKSLSCSQTSKDSNETIKVSRLFGGDSYSALSCKENGNNGK